MAIEHYEIYYFQNGRWHVHARYEADEREVAIEEAVSVESKLGYPARVIRETFYPDTNTTEESVTYQGNKAKNIADADNMFGGGPQSAGPGKKGAGGPQQRGKTGGPGDGGSRATGRGDREGTRDRGSSERQQRGGGTSQSAKAPQRKDAPPEARRTRKKAKNAIVVILTGFVLSLFVSVVGTVAVTLLLFQMVESGMIPSGNRNALVFGMFMLLFFGTGFLYLNKQFNLVKLFRKQPRAANAKRGPPPKTVPKQQAAPTQAGSAGPGQQSTADLADEDLDAIARRVALDGEETGGSAAPRSLDEEGFDSGTGPKKPDDGKSAKKDAKKEKEDKKKAAAKKKEEERKKKEEEKKAKESEAKAKEEEKRKAAEKKKKEKTPADSVKPEFLKFLTDAFTSIQAEHPQLNTFSKFGMNLYMCGACQTICATKGLPGDVMQTVLIEGLGLIGTNSARAKSFCDEIPSYGGNPRYAGMIQAGTEAMNNFLAGQANANSGLSALLTEWNLPEKRPSVPNMFTFLFTDIVGSTAMTQRLGNVGAQKAVRAHNDAVRGAIQQFNGREVKHTGDGIMATFPDGPSAVGASIQMLQGIQSHNQASPETTVEIRIGVNTGEAVEEENDFFGQAVQTTARICDKAADGHAWVSEVVLEACQGQRYKFLPRGEFEMKGLDKPKPLFEVAWTDAHRDELADL